MIVVRSSNRCELLTLEIYFLESVCSLVGCRQKATAGTRLTIIIDESVRIFLCLNSLLFFLIHRLEGF